MDVRLHTRNAHVDDPFRDRVMSKVSNTGRIYDHATQVDVELSESHNPRRTSDRFHIELTSLVGGRVLRIASDGATAEDALDDAVERFSRQLRRHKERLIDARRRPTPPPEPEPMPAPSGEVVRTKQFVMKPMSIDEAALQMEMLGHAFFVFQNSANDKQCVLYRRRDGRLGLIEPA